MPRPSARAFATRRQAPVLRSDLRTLSAWNFASPGQALQHLKSRWSARLGDVIAKDGLFYGGRSSRIPCRPPHGVDFISQRDAFLIRPIPRRVILPGIPRELLFAPKGALLIAARGTLGEGELFGRPVLATGALRRYGITEDLLRLVPEPDQGATTYAYLSTLVGLRLLRSTAVGTKILNLRFDLLRELPFPELSEKQSAALVANVSAAMDAKERAENAEASAVSIVEQEVLPTWLA